MRCNEYCKSISAVDVVKYEGIGCYNDNMSRPLPILLKSFRDTIDWENEWPSFDRVIKKCAELAHTKGYLYFAIQFYGECWTGVDAYKTFNKNGKSTRCTHGVGKQWANFVYMITQGKELIKLFALRRRHGFDPRIICE